MLTKRTLLMTATGLLVGYLAAGQTTMPNTAAAPSSDALFWVLVGLLGIIGLMVLVTGTSLASATRRPALPTVNQPVTTAEKGATAC